MPFTFSWPLGQKPNGVIHEVGTGDKPAGQSCGMDVEVPILAAVLMRFFCAHVWATRMG